MASRIDRLARELEDARGSLARRVEGNANLAAKVAELEAGRAKTEPGWVGWARFALGLLTLAALAWWAPWWVPVLLFTGNICLTPRTGPRQGERLKKGDKP